MEPISTEQKLELVRQIRLKYDENCSDMGKREKALYGRCSYGGADATVSVYKGDQSRYYDEAAETDRGVSFGRVRFWITLVLLVGVIYLDQNESVFPEFDIEKVFSVISQDYEEEIAVWVNTVKERETE